MERLFSGIQPTGEIHIGNYLGAIKNWVALLDQYECFFCIVDYHAITIPYPPEEMAGRIRETAKVNIACGLDPKKCILFVQSEVPEHTELCWILGTLTPIAFLERMTQFKDKALQHRANVNAGLFNYPVLQAADILLYKASAVPVGEDQAQHLELGRDIARKFNRTFGETFPEPRTLFGEAPRIMGLDGKFKMSKSKDNYIALLDSKEVLWEKLRGAVTDENRKRRRDPGNPCVCNIFSLHSLLTLPERIKEIEEGCRTAGIGCVDCKKILLDSLVKTLAPIQEKKKALDQEEGILNSFFEEGKKRAGRIAKETMEEVRDKIGVLWRKDSHGK